MNIFTTILCVTLLATGGPASAQTLCDNVETTRLVSYPVAQGTFTQNAAHPGANAVNGSSTCALYTRDAAQQYAVIVVKPAGPLTADVNTAALAPGLYTCRLVVDGVALTRPLSVE